MINLEVYLDWKVKKLIHIWCFQPKKPLSFENGFIVKLLKRLNSAKN